jgi:hypothetical protein
MDRKVYPRSIGLPPTMFERALDFRELVFLREDSSVIFQTRHGINPHLRIIYYCSSALSIFWLISSMSRALRAGKGRFIPRSETIGSSIPSIVTMKLPFPGFSLLISTKARSPTALEILLARVWKAPHFLEASTVTTGLSFPSEAFLEDVAFFFFFGSASTAAFSFGSASAASFFFDSALVFFVLALVAFAFLGGEAFSDLGGAATFSALGAFSFAGGASFGASFAGGASTAVLASRADRRVATMVKDLVEKLGVIMVGLLEQ